MRSLDAVLDKLEEIICLLALSVMTLSILLQIINRSFLGHPFPWGEELARYTMIWATAMGVSAGVKIGSHIGVDMLVNLFPPKSKTLILIVTGMITLAFFVTAFYLSVKLVGGIKATGQTSPAIHLPMWLAYLAFPIGFAFCSLRQIQLIIKKASELNQLYKGLPKEGLTEGGAQ
jgi:C4-dicarboxylate transporter DctQ subunit